MLPRSLPSLVLGLLLVHLVSVTLRAENPAAAPLTYEVGVALQEDAAWPEDGLLLVARPPEDVEAEPIANAVSSPSVAPMSLPEPIGAGWTVTCKGDGVWCPTRVLLDETPRLRLPVFPQTSFEASLQPPRGEALPETLELLIEGWILQEGRPPVGFTVPANSEEGRLSWAGPARRQDLRITTEGWVPLYRWDVEATPDSSVKLGPLELVRGGSVCGFAEHARSGEILANLEVRLQPAVDPQAVLPPEEEERMLRLERQSSTNDRGFFQIAGVPAGGYRMTLLDLTGSLAPLSIQSVEVTAGTETCFPELSLSPFLTLTVQVDPPSDPTGLPWRVQALPLPPEAGESVHRVATLPDGTARVSGLRPKPHLIEVLSSDGQRFASLREELVDDLVLPIELDLVEIDGRVTVGDEGLAARIEIETGQMDKVRLESNEDGFFSGWARSPAHQLVLVEVTAEEPPLSRRVEIREPQIRDDVLVLRIRLGDRALQGRVEDPEGAPVSSAEVVVRNPDGRSQSRKTDADGRFEIQGLEEGSHQISAHHPDIGRSAWTSLEPPPQGSVDEVILTLEPETELAVEVRDASGSPVQGARVTLLFPPPAATWLRGFTDVQGQILLNAPDNPLGAAIVQVAAPSQMIWSGCLAREPEGFVVNLPSGPPGAARLVTRSSPDRPPPTGGEAVLLTDDRGMLTSSDLAEWTMLTTGALGGETVAGLAPGRYTRVWRSQPWWELAAELCLVGPPPGVEWETLAPGATVELPLDVRGVQ